jgi:hypothetical protein
MEENRRWDLTKLRPTQDRTQWRILVKVVMHTQAAIKTCNRQKS